MAEKANIGGALKGLLSNPLTRRIAQPILEAALPKIREKVGRRPLLAIGAGAAGAAAGVQYLGSHGVVIPEGVAQPLGLGILLAGWIAGQATVTPVGQPRLTPAQAAKVVVLPAKAKVAKAAKKAA